MTDLAEIAREYVDLKGIQLKPVMIAIERLYEACGEKPLEDYNRQDARHFVKSYGNVKTTTLRRRLNSINAVFNWAAYELDLDGKNPFARLIIKGEGRDAETRQPFSTEELGRLYPECLAYGKLRLILPILGETGARLSEVLGASKKDVIPFGSRQFALRVQENGCRGLKTGNSRREVPILGDYAQKALEVLLEARSDNQFLFPRYAREGYLNSTGASATLCKFLKANYGAKTTHCLRHSMRDRLRNAEVPLEAIDQIGGWSAVGGVGTNYGMGYSMDKLAEYLGRVVIR